MTWISIKTGAPSKKRLIKKHPKSCSICGKEYLGYIRNNRPNKYCLDCSKKIPKNTSRKPEKNYRRKKVTMENTKNKVSFNKQKDCDRNKTTTKKSNKNRPNRT